MFGTDHRTQDPGHGNRWLRSEFLGDSTTPRRSDPRARPNDEYIWQFTLHPEFLSDDRSVQFRYCS